MAKKKVNKVKSAPLTDSRKCNPSIFCVFICQRVIYHFKRRIFTFWYQITLFIILISVMRIPVTVITATIQFGKKIGVITFIGYALLLFYIQDFHPSLMTEQFHFANLDQFAAIEFSTKLKNSALLQALAILSVSFYNGTFSRHFYH